MPNRATDTDHLKYAFVLPTLVILIALNIFPFFYNLYLSFTHAELSGGLSRWIGGRNYGVIFDPKQAYEHSVSLATHPSTF